MGMYFHKQTQDKTFKANKVLEDGDEIREIEYTFKAIHTPGYFKSPLLSLRRREDDLYRRSHYEGLQ